MSMTILFDLDDTLIGNDMDTFLKVYLKELSQYIQDIPPQQFISELLSATGKMAANRQPGQTLEEAFDGAFYPAIGQTKEDLGERIEHFYKNIFPGFEYLTQPRPEAAALVRKVMEKGADVVIATNPLFPRMATQHRLNWAGLPVERFPFKIVTSYEDFHFAKPNPAYYMEILARLGYPGRPAVMVGNSWEDDIRPAELVGLPTFWLNGTHTEDGSLLRHPLSRSGAFDEIGPWLEEIAGETVAIPGANPEVMYPALLAAPAVLDFYRRKLEKQSWGARPAEDSWSVLETACHMHDTEKEIYAPRMRRFMSEAKPHFTGIDPSGWAQLRNYRAQDLNENIEGFTIERLNWLALIKDLAAPGWQRQATHSEVGTVTLLSLAHTIAKHDCEHIHQIVGAVEGLGLLPA